MPYSGTLGERITALRNEKRISQKELADSLYVNQATISRWEKGIRFPDDDLIVKMAQLFGVDPDILLAPPYRQPLIILVDDEPISLEINVPMMRDLVPNAEILGFSTGKGALALAAEKQIDIAFLDIDLMWESGIDLADKLNALYPNVNIIFLTGHPEFMKTAFHMHASGYILKPMSPDDFLNEIRHLRFPVEGLSMGSI